MAIARSKLTAQGQVSIPAEVRRKLGVSPGSVLEWNEEEAGVVVRRAGRFSAEDVHRALFSRKPRRRTQAQIESGIRKYVKRKHALR